MGETGLRADAELNRRKILQAARELFATEGTAVSMRQIALRAGPLPPGPSESEAYRQLLKLSSP